MKIATFNINSVGARIELLTQWLRTENPDVVLLQEIKTEYNAFPFFELQALGYDAKVLGQKSYNRRCGFEPGTKSGLSAREFPVLPMKTAAIWKLMSRTGAKLIGLPRFICLTATLRPTIPEISPNWPTSCGGWKLFIIMRAVCSCGINR